MGYGDLFEIPHWAQEAVSLTYPVAVDTLKKFMLLARLKVGHSMALIHHKQLGEGLDQSQFATHAVFFAQ